MLHLQDTYAGKKSLEGKAAEEIAEDLGGGFMPELIDIELADWTKKSERELAIDAGLEEIYRLVFDPTSPDIHGTWISLKNSNLGRCAQPGVYHRKCGKRSYAQRGFSEIFPRRSRKSAKQSIQGRKQF